MWKDDKSSLFLKKGELFMSLFDQITSEIEKNGVAKNRGYISTYETGIKILDNNNAIYNADTNSYLKGIDAGTLTMFIGQSGSGKTTAALNIAGNIVRDRENALIIHLDFERASKDARVKKMLRFSDEEFATKYERYDSEISSEKFYALCKLIHKQKMAMYDSIKVDTGVTDSKGNPIYELPPTIIILDSLATMYSDGTNQEEEMSGQMSTTAEAKLNNQIIKRLVASSILEQANIMLFVINHITTKIDINPMQKTPSALNYLKQNEALPGGSSFPFLANFLLKFTAKDKLDPNGKSSTNTRYGIKGFINEITIIKSRTSESGRTFRVAFSQVEGFLDDVSSMMFLEENKLLHGSNRAYYIPTYPDQKFTAKTIHTVYSDPENAEFRAAFDAYANKYMESIIPRTTDDKIRFDENGKRYELFDAAEDIWISPSDKERKYYDYDFNEVQVVEED